VTTLNVCELAMEEAKVVFTEDQLRIAYATKKGCYSRTRSGHGVHPSNNRRR
jgi:hypothetical protein